MEEPIELLKRRCRMYNRGLVSFDDVSGYLQALSDLGYLGANDVKFVVESLLSNRAGAQDWMYE